MRQLILVLMAFLLSTPVLSQVDSDHQKLIKEKQQQVHWILLQERAPSMNGKTLNQLNNLNTNYTSTELEFSSDTSWSYEEVRHQNDTTFIPSFFMQLFDEGNSSTFKRIAKNFDWIPESEGEEKFKHNKNRTLGSAWQLNTSQYSWYNNSFTDSTIFYGYNDEEQPTSGNRYIYIKEPAEGATTEYYWDDFEAGVGWKKYSRELSYTNEDHSHIWSKTFLFDERTNDYFFHSHTVNQEETGFGLYENKMLSPEVITYWVKSYTKYNQDSRTEYSIYSVLDHSLQLLLPSDSTSYIYHDDFAEAYGYVWENQDWVLDNYTKTFESPSVKNHHGVKTDSILTYEMEYDAVGDSIKIGSVISKSIWTYDMHENDIKAEFYTLINGELRINSRRINEFQLFGDQYLLTRSTIYSLDWNSYELFLASDDKIYYTESGEESGSESFNLSVAGDTLYGYSRKLYTEGETMFRFNYQWSTEEHRFQLTNYLVNAETEPVAQATYIDEEHFSHRYLDVRGGLPAVFNEGPLFIQIDDTLDITLSARNPDASVPEIQVSNMPATATFDPQTRRFYWVVDEENPEPMRVTAVDGSQSTFVDVKFYSGEFTVTIDNEPTIPAQVELFQNYPNPFNPETTVEFNLPQSEKVNLRVFSILGQEVSTLVNKEMPSGIQKVIFNANGLSSGVYFYQLKVGNSIQTRKMTLIK